MFAQRSGYCGLGKLTYKINHQRTIDFKIFFLLVLTQFHLNLPDFLPSSLCPPPSPFLWFYVVFQVNYDIISKEFYLFSSFHAFNKFLSDYIFNIFNIILKTLAIMSLISFFSEFNRNWSSISYYLRYGLFIFEKHWINYFSIECFY